VSKDAFRNVAIPHGQVQQPAARPKGRSNEDFVVGGERGRRGGIDVMTIKKILCAIDLTKASRNAFDRALSIARVSGARLYILHAQHHRLSSLPR
jgi:Universal stress protein family